MGLGDIITEGDLSYDTETGLYYDAATDSVIDPGTVANTAVANNDWGFLADIANVIPTIVAGLNSYQISQINIARAQKGMPLINAQALSPQVGVNVGLSSQTTKMLMWGAAGLAGVFLLSRMGRR